MTSSYVGSLSPLATYFNSMSNVSGSGNYTNYYSTAMGSNANFSSEEDYNSYMNALYNDREVSMSSLCKQHCMKVIQSWSNKF